LGFGFERAVVFHQDNVVVEDAAEGFDVAEFVGLIPRFLEGKNLGARLSVGFVLRGGPGWESGKPELITKGWFDSSVPASMAGNSRHFINHAPTKACAFLQSLAAVAKRPAQKYSPTHV
jgi:hypothetical protein